jgi:hypothetical protein
MHYGLGVLPARRRKPRDHHSSDRVTTKLAPGTPVLVKVAEESLAEK